MKTTIPKRRFSLRLITIDHVTDVAPARWRLKHFRSEFRTGSQTLLHTGGKAVALGKGWLFYGSKVGSNVHCFKTNYVCLIVKDDKNNRDKGVDSV